MKKVFSINSSILAVIILLLATYCTEEELTKVPISESNSKSGFLAESDSISDCGTRGNLPEIVTANVYTEYTTDSTITFVADIKTCNLPTVVYFLYGTRGVDYRDSVKGTIRTDCCNDPENGYFEYIGTATGLEPGTKYTWSPHATNSYGTSSGCSFGDNFSYSTLPGKPNGTSTLPATIISVNGATLNGTVNGEGLSTTVTFEYDTNTDIYDIPTSYRNSVIASQSPVADNGIINVSADISGLDPCLIYHFRIKAENSLWVRYGSDQQFRTSTQPTLTTTPASGITATSAIVGGEITDDGGAPITDRGICYYPVWYGIIKHFTHDSTGNERFTTSLAELIPNTTYIVRSFAVNCAGTAYGENICFTTLPLCDQVPTATTLAATDITSTGATLNGTVNANGLSTTVTFEYKELGSMSRASLFWKNVSATQSPITGTTLINVSAEVTRLAPNRLITFRVKAENSCGRVYGAISSFR